MKKGQVLSYFLSDYLHADPIMSSPFRLLYNYLCIKKSSLTHFLFENRTSVVSYCTRIHSRLLRSSSHPCIVLLSFHLDYCQRQKPFLYGSKFLA